ncbi:MAG: regulatory protein RecX [Fidelibacterota bacterium]|nr:MAG: regulatory protein RecX [Candidatus Neomarinimicrobiota bacterium]
MRQSPVSDDEGQRAREAAFRLLAVRARSARELQQRLRKKGFPPELIDNVIADLQAKGYQSDEDFTRLYAREKWNNSGWGPARVRQELRTKGIASELIDRVVGETYAEADLAEAVLSLAQKRWQSTEGLPIDTRRRRLTGFLQRRGYDWDIVNKVLEQVREGP